MPRQLLLSPGKNMFNVGGGIVQRFYYDASGIPQVSALDYIQSDYMPVSASTQYTMSANASTALKILQYTSDKVYIRRDTVTATSLTVTAQSNAAYVRLSGLTAQLPSTQFESGAVATSYASYVPVRQLATGRVIPTKSRQPIGELVYNGDFEYAPPFTAPTDTTTRWIDGTAAGSSTNDVYRWGIFTVIGTVSARFDPTTPISGLSSLKISTVSGGAKIEVSNLLTNSTTNTQRYGILVSPSTSYTATFKMRCVNNGGTSSGDGAIMDIVERTASGGFVASNKSTPRVTTTATQQYTITFTTSATTKYLTPKCVIDGSAGAATLTMDAWFDLVSIMPTTPTTRQLIT
jgi:hypothetical protein